MAEKTDIELFLDWSQRWVVEGIYPIIGSVVNNGLAKLEAEGFTREEARYWLEALTILQVVRIGMPVPPFQQRYWVPEAKVYTEQEILAIAAAGETIPTIEYTGFEGRY
jgi:hypothetical protein